jgi:predicted transposase YbfD/YdcC
MHLYHGCSALPKKTLISVKNTGNEAILQVKENQKTLLRDCEKATAKTIKPKDKYTTKDKGRNRIEIRKVETYTRLKPLLTQSIRDGWSEYIKMIIKVTRIRKVFDTKKKHYIKSSEASYHISTVKLTAKQAAQAVRGHWGIENRNHYVRDVSMNEDKSRIRVRADIMVRLRSFALNILRINKVENINQELKRNSFNITRIFDYTGLI